MPTFAYTPLDLSASNSIRLLRLRKGYYTDNLECELFDSVLSDTEGLPYEALSYDRSNTTGNTHISINGQKAEIGWNLNLALHCLRQIETDRILWVDEICINQSDNEEKSHQIAQIGTIYRSAEDVLAWLGPANEETDVVMTLMNTFEKRAMSEPSFRPSARVHWEAVWEEIVDQSWGPRSDFYATRKATIEELLRRPYFRRIWTTQELFKARRATVICGWKSISSRTFSLMPSFLDAEVEEWAAAILDIMPGHSRKSSLLSGGLDLETLIKAYSRGDAPHLRDGFYALLGIASDAAGNDVFRPDYQIDDNLVAQNALAFMVFRNSPDKVVPKLPDWSLGHLLDLTRNSRLLATELFKWALNNSNQLLAENIINRKEFDVNQNGDLGQTPLQLLAHYKEHTSVLRTLLLRDDVNLEVTESGKTAFHIAVNLGNTSVIKELLTRDIDIARPDSDGMPPLALAAKAGHDDVVGFLLDHGANIEVKTEPAQETPLWIAAEGSRLETVELLLQRGARVDAADQQTGRTPLWIAAERGDLLMVKRLIEAGANLEAKNRTFNNTTLGGAIEARRWRVAKLLLTHGANPLAHFYNGETLPTRVAKLGEPYFLEYIHQIGVSLDGQDAQGRTALHMAARENKLRVIDFLLEKRVRTDIKNQYGETAFMEACIHAPPETVRKLLAHCGAELETPDDGKRTPLISVAAFCQSEVAEILLKAGANVNASNYRGATALMVIQATATYRDTMLNGDELHTEVDDMVKLLIEHGAELNVQDSAGRTALSYAAQRGYWGAVEMMLDHGADKDIRDRYGKTALSYSDHPKVTRALTKPMGKWRFLNRETNHVFY